MVHVSDSKVYNGINQLLILEGVTSTSLIQLYSSGKFTYYYHTSYSFYDTRTIVILRLSYWTYHLPTLF